MKQSVSVPSLATRLHRLPPFLCGFLIWLKVQVPKVDFDEWMENLEIPRSKV